MELIAQVDIGQALGSPIGMSIGLADLVAIVLSNAVSIAAIILLILFVLGGLAIIMGAGQNDPQRTAQGRQAITAAVIGFVIIFISYWIIQLLGVLFGIDFLSPVV